MTESDIYQKHLEKMYDLHGSGEGAVLSYIKRNMMRFEKGGAKGFLPVRKFAELGFNRVLKEMAERGLDFRLIKVKGITLPQTVLDDYLERAKWYDPDCLKEIIQNGHYDQEDLANSYIKLCHLHKEALENNDKTIDCLSLDVVTDAFLKEGMDFSHLTTDGEVPFYALCSVYDKAKSVKEIPNIEAYEKMVFACIKKGLDQGVDLNVVDKNYRTGFSVKSGELKGLFVRYQQTVEDKRLLDLFVIVEQLAKGAVESQMIQKISSHITQLKKDIINSRKRMNIR